MQGDTSIAQVALQHGLITNLVQTWIRKAKRQSQRPIVSDFVLLPAPSASEKRCPYLFANRRGNRMKVLTHDGLGAGCTPGV